MFSDVYFAVIMIFGIVLAAACYAVRRLEGRPARIASVLTALAFLIGALVPVVRLLTESATRPVEVVAPTAPATIVPPGGSPAPSAVPDAPGTPLAEGR